MKSGVMMGGYDDYEERETNNESSFIHNDEDN